MRALPILCGLFALLLPSGCVHGSQGSVGTFGQGFPDTMMERFKQTTTLLPIPDSRSEQIPQFQTELDKIWDINRLKVMSFSDAAPLLGDSRYSRFVVQRLVESDGNGGVDVLYYLRLDLNVPADATGEQREEASRLPLARVELHPNWYTRARLYPAAFERDVPLDQIYREADFGNFTPTVLVSALTEVHSDLKLGSRRALTDPKLDYDGLAELSTATLYVPEYVKLGQGAIYRSHREHGAVFNARDLGRISAAVEMALSY